MKNKIVSVLTCILLLTTIFTSVTVYANEWPMFRHNQYHTGFTDAESPDTSVVRWTAETDDYVDSSPAVANGLVYIGSNDSKLYCYYAANGTEKWNFTTGGPIHSSPAVYNGMVFVGSYDKKMYCINAQNGSEIWNYTTTGKIWSSPTIANGKVYFGSNNKRVYCLNTTDNGVNWIFLTGGAVFSSPAVVNGIVYIGSNDYRVYYINAANGTEIFNFSTGGMVRSSPALMYNKVYVGSDDGKIYCLYASNCTQKWNVTTGGIVRSSPAISDGRVYIGSDDWKMYCLDAEDRTEIWNFTTTGAIRSSPAIAQGKLFFGAARRVYCINTHNISENWFYVTGKAVRSSPAVAYDKVYVGSNDHKVYCFEDNHPPNTPTLEGYTKGTIGVTHTFYARATDPDENQLYYLFDWGEGNESGWIGPYDSGEEVNGYYTFNEIGNYSVKVKVKDIHDEESSYSQELLIRIYNTYAPDKPSNPQPVNNTMDTNLSISLSVLLVDQDNDSMDVEFYYIHENASVLINKLYNITNNTRAEINWSGLNHNTTYRWFAVAYDQIFETKSDVWHFSTYINYAPDMPESPLPANNSIDVGLNISLSVLAVDQNNDSMDVEFYYIEGNESILIDTAYNVTNNTRAEVNWSGLLHNTTYQWFTIAYDQFSNTSSDVWNFTTYINQAPNKPTLLSPANNSINKSLKPKLRVLISDPNGESMDVFFYHFHNNVSDLIGYALNVPSGSIVQLNMSELSHSTTYEWYVVVNDTFLSNTSDKWKFTTKAPNLTVDILHGLNLGIKAKIENNDDSNATNIEWYFSITGGLLRLINVSDDGLISLIEPGENVILRKFKRDEERLLLGFGRVEITVETRYNNIMIEQDTKNGFMLGPFIFVRRGILSIT